MVPLSVEFKQIMLKYLSARMQVPFGASGYFQCRRFPVEDSPNREAIREIKASFGSMLLWPGPALYSRLLLRSQIWRHSPNDGPLWLIGGH